MSYSHYSKSECNNLNGKVDYPLSKYESVKIYWLSVTFDWFK